MEQPTKEQIESVLMGIISDGFNRSIRALEDAGAISTTKLREHFSGVGSKYYEVVTEQIEITAKYGVKGIRTLYSNDESLDSSSP